MPSPLAIPLIAAGANILGGVLGNASTANQNAKSRAWQEHMYDRQRTDALADWNRQNEYNNPAAQMLRFKEAGLNPNLIYGQSNTAPSVRSSSTGTPQFNPQNYSFIADAFNAFVHVSQLQAQTDNVKAQTELAKQRAKLAGQTFDFGEDSYGYRLQTKYEQMQKLRNENLILTPQKVENVASTIAARNDANNRAALKNVSDLKTAAAKRAQMDVQNAKTNADRLLAMERLKYLRSVGFTEILKQTNLGVQKELLEVNRDLKKGELRWQDYEKGMKAVQTVTSVAQDLSTKGLKVKAPAGGFNSSDIKNWGKNNQTIFKAGRRYSR